VDVVKEYRQMAEDLREQELQRALRALSRGDDPGQLLAQLARGLTNKLIHAPTAGLKQASAEGRVDQLGAARKLLGLQQPQDETPAPESTEETDLTDARCNESLSPE
jgi:glutamyl-tRNA reductase